MGAWWSVIQRFPLYRQLAAWFASQQLATLRFDKRSCRSCYPAAQLSDHAFRFDHLYDDARDAIDAARKHPRIDPKRLLLVGHSQGGGIAVQLAAERSDVIGVITLAAQIDTLETSLLEQFDAYAQLRARQWDALGWLTLRQQRNDYAACFARLHHHFVAEEQCVGGGVTQRAPRVGPRTPGAPGWCADITARAAADVAGQSRPAMSPRAAFDNNATPSQCTHSRGCNWSTGSVTAWCTDETAMRLS